MGAPTASAENPFRSLPSVDELLKHEGASALVARFGRSPVIAAIRDDLERLREAIRKATGALPGSADPLDVLDRVTVRLTADARRHHGHAINATGVILHTGLGRAPLAQAARDAVLDVARGYSIVEVDRRTGERNHREEAIAGLLRELTGAEAATVVNNNAAATLICLAALAAGRGVVVSRGQLVEIGGSFRIPDVMAQSGARLIEVGTTNKTHPEDYERALADARNDVALVLRVHPSNFRIVGFTSEVSLAELVALARRRGLPVMDDLGSGCLIDMTRFGLPGEPLVPESLAAGAAVATFSGDKLLGGPQAGLIVGEKASVERIRKHPLFRAIRPDKLTLAALEATLMLYRDPARALTLVPVLRMLAVPLAEIAVRADSLAVAASRNPDAFTAGVQDDASMVGGGSYAIERIPTRVLALTPRRGSGDALAEKLRLSEPPIFTRISEGRVLLDPRTIDPQEDGSVARTLEAVQA
jgi:L-seryl-tRNA(Ser) seleniumtransferase